MSKLLVILPKPHKNYVLVRQFWGSIREKSSRCICTKQKTEKSGKTCLEITTNSAKFGSNLSKQTFGKQILKPFSLTSQSYGLSFSTTLCLEKGDERRQKPLSNTVHINCDDSKEKVKDLEESPEDCEETTKSKSSKKKRKKKKRKRRKRKQRKEHEEDDCEDDENHRKKKKEESDKNVEHDDSKDEKLPAMKSWPVCKPRARKYRDPYKKEGTAGYLESLLQCGPKQCEILTKFLVSSLLFYLATLALLFYCTDWKPWKREEEPAKKVKKKEVEVREAVEEEKPIVVEEPEEQHEEKETKHIEVLDVESVCGDQGHDSKKMKVKKEEVEVREAVEQKPKKQHYEHGEKVTKHHEVLDENAHGDENNKMKKVKNKEVEVRETVAEKPKKQHKEHEEKITNEDCHGDNNNETKVGSGTVNVDNRTYYQYVILSQK